MADSSVPEPRVPEQGVPAPTGPAPAASAPEVLDLLVVGAGPTGIAIGAEARRRGLSVLLVDQGPLCAAIQAYPVDLRFFTTRDLLEIADVPFTIAEDKPNRRQTLVYYRSVVEHYGVPLALHEKVLAVHPPAGEGSGEGDGEGGPAGDGLFTVDTEHRGGRLRRRARAVAVATGYFFNPDRLGVPGEDLPWVGRRYLDPYRHFGDHVVVVGAGNTAAEAALDLWRNGVRVTLVHRGQEVKRSIKYWLKPDIENRIAAGSIAARFDTLVTGFGEQGEERWVEVRPAEASGSEAGGGTAARGGAAERIPCDAAYVFIGYEPDVTLQVEAGVEVDPETLIPAHDPETCESNVPGLYLAGTLLAGKATDQIFIENSRGHAPRIVGHILGSKKPTAL